MGLFGTGALRTMDGGKGEDEAGCRGSWQGVQGSDLAAISETGQVSGSGLDTVAWRGFGATLGLAGRVCVLLSGNDRSSLFGASELGVEIHCLV